MFTRERFGVRGGEMKGNGGGQHVIRMAAHRKRYSCGHRKYGNFKFKGVLFPVDFVVDVVVFVSAKKSHYNSLLSHLFFRHTNTLELFTC